ncbi:LysR substrate-binding domain-containing protein [Pseudomonas baetica]|uniref:LysR family transcriptional regulator n=1 Tax=Pseudomonas baetica TaxID=674054 RepID=UPI003EEC2F43
MNKLPDLEAWAIFAKVAETGSFARAANDLSLSQATVSKAVTRLEKRTNTTLFHRTSRRISLTESGLAALETAARILEEGKALEAAVREKSTTLQGRIRVAAPMSFGIMRLAPMLPEFMAAHPDITLDVQFNDEKVNLIDGRYDLAVRISNMENSSLLVRRICQVRVLLVGAPAYFERYGRPQHPHDLVNHRALQYSNSGTGESWRFRHPQHGEYSQIVRAQVHANNAEALTPALLAGQGLALHAEFLVWNQLQTGQLEVAMQDWVVDPIELHILTPPGRRRPARVQALINYLATCMANESWVRTPVSLSPLAPDA